MKDIKNKIEAVLFITGRAMSIEEIAQFCNIASLGSVKEAMHSLQKEYSQHEGSLEISEEEGKYRLNIKKNFTHLSTRLLSAAELDTPTQATLALIAYKQPVLQSEIIKMRGNTAYDHIHELKTMEFIVSEKSGRTRVLKLAAKFFEYFDVIEENLKQKLNETVEKQEKLIEKTTENPLEKKDEEKVLEVIPAIKEKKKKKNDSEEKAKNNAMDVPLEIERASPQILLSLDADDFGSRS